LASSFDDAIHYDVVLNKNCGPNIVDGNIEIPDEDTAIAALKIPDDETKCYPGSARIVLNTKYALSATRTFDVVVAAFRDPSILNLSGEALHPYKPLPMKEFKLTGKIVSPNRDVNPSYNLAIYTDASLRAFSLVGGHSKIDCIDHLKSAAGHWDQICWADPTDKKTRKYMGKYMFSSSCDQQAGGIVACEFSVRSRSVAIAIPGIARGLLGDDYTATQSAYVGAQIQMNATASLSAIIRLEPPYIGQIDNGVKAYLVSTTFKKVNSDFAKPPTARTQEVHLSGSL
jgi:hypothetical protein